MLKGTIWDLTKLELIERNSMIFRTSLRDIENLIILYFQKFFLFHFPLNPLSNLTLQIGSLWHCPLKFDRA